MKSTTVPVIAVLFLALIGAGLMLGGFFDDDTTDDQVVESGRSTADRSQTARTEPNDPGAAATTPKTGIRTSKFTSTADGRGKARRLDGDDTGIVARGVVVDPEGRPVPNARVALIQDVSQVKSRPQDGELLLEIQTGDDGRFNFENLEVHEVYIIRAMHDDFTTVRVHPIDPNVAHTLRHEIKLEEGLGMQGSVVDNNGVPVSEAKISVYDLNVSSLDPRAEPERVAWSGNDGSYEVKHLKPGLKRVIVRKEGFATDGRNGLNLTSDEMAKIDFTLGRGHTIRGIVKDRRSQQPIEGALVNARLVSMLAPQRNNRTIDNTDNDAPREFNNRRPLGARAGGANAFHVEVVATDENGEFTLSGLQEARYVLSVTCKGYQIANGQPADAGQDGILIEMAPSPRISGTVVDDETGEPVTEFEIATSTTPNPTFLPKRLRQRFTDEEGRFTYLDVRVGTHYVIARAPGYAGGRSESITVAAEEDRAGVVIRLVKGATLSGIVRNDAGEPVKGARISLAQPSVPGADPAGELFKKLIQQQMRTPGSRSAVTDDKGQWKIAHVLGGTYSVKVEHGDYTEAKSPPVDCPDRGEVAAPDVVLKRGGIIRGTVRNKDGTPDAKATVMISSDDPTRPFNRSQKTDANGTFSVKGLRPGNYRVVVAQRNGQFDLVRILQSRNDSSTLVTVTEGGVVEVNR